MQVLCFWSDQYDRKIQLAGRIGPGGEMHVVTGSLFDRQRSPLSATLTMCRLSQCAEGVMEDGAARADQDPLLT